MKKICITPCYVKSTTIHRGKFLLILLNPLIPSPSSLSGWKINICDVCMANLFIYDQFMWLQLENYYGFSLKEGRGRRRRRLLQWYKSFGVKGIESPRTNSFYDVLCWWFVTLGRVTLRKIGPKIISKWPSSSNILYSLRLVVFLPIELALA